MPYQNTKKKKIYREQLLKFDAQYDKITKFKKKKQFMNF